VLGGVESHAFTRSTSRFRVGRADLTFELAEEGHMAETETNFQTNLRRLVHFEHRSGREAAQALGVQERTISQWLTGKRYPSGQMLAEIDRLYGISPRDLDLDPDDFAQRLADRDRLEHVRMAITRARVDQIKSRQGERVVPIKKGRKS
jgi:transcriptional regulator with XRE-family HTH domain